MVCSTGGGVYVWEVLSPTIPESCGKPGEGGALDDSSDYFGKCPVLRRKEWVEANLACERKKK